MDQDQVKGRILSSTGHNILVIKTMNKLPEETGQFIFLFFCELNPLIREGIFNNLLSLIFRFKIGTFHR
jgi:hypothetical protein